jgi:TonB-linked SusC/RagA family outer membrane protein
MRKLLGLFAILTLCIHTGFAQQREITGTVVNETDGTPAVGVLISVSGTSTVVASDAKGRFSITASADATLQFVQLGLVTQTVPLGGRTEIVVTMVTDAQSIENVVVVGYGTQLKTHLTGAVSAIDGDEIASKPSTDVLSSLQGKLPGVAVLRTSGQPGQETANGGLRIRGFSSANEASALVLIDGVEGSLTNLNPEDIESVSVLKDAASASIYGSRAAAGVVLVTTKKGVTSERVRVSYNGSFGFNVPGAMPQRMPAWEEQDFINLARFNDRGVVEQNPEVTSWVGNPNFNYYPNGARWGQNGSTNWLAEGTKNYSTQQSHAVTLSGGHGKTNYYMSGGFYTKNGMLRHGPNDFDRYNLRVNLNSEMSKYVSAGVKVSYEGTLREEPTYNAPYLLSQLYSARGRQSIYLPEEDTNYDVNPYSSDLQWNPIQVMKEGGQVTYNQQYFTGNANLQIKNVVKGLVLDLNASRRAGVYAATGEYIFRPSMGRNGARRAGYDINNPGRVNKTKSSSYQDKLEALLNYDLKWRNHHIHLLGGASYEQYLDNSMTAEARNLLSEDLFSLNYYNSDVATNSVLSDAVRPWKMASLFGRVNYNLAGRYMFEAVVRYDGSSRLAPGNRWGTFPSFSAAWRISEESFFEPLTPVVNNLKLRASWGQLGNSTALNSMYYPYIGTITNRQETNSNPGILSIMGNPVYYQKDMVSSNVTWETVQTTNIGVDMGLFRNRLDITADYYWKKNDGMLAKLRVGNIAGVVNLPYQNAGVLKVWGWEISAQWRDKIGEFSYNIGASIEDSQNKLVKYDGNNVIRAGQVKLLEGYSLNTIWGYKTDGFWNSREEYLEYKAANPGYSSFQDAKVSGGDVRYLTQGKADHTVGIGGGTPENPGDLVCLGTSNGRYLYSINMGAEWKGFDFSMFWQGVGKRSFVVAPTTLAPLGASWQMPWTIHRDYWREDNKDAYFARPVENQTYNYNPSDRWVQNGAYIRLKNIQLGYTIPIPSNIIQSLRVYVQGTDVLEFTKTLSVFDPEVSPKATDTDGVTNQYYPFFRTWTLGLNLTF